MTPSLAKLGVTIEPFYDRTELVRKTIHTVAKNLIEGGILVIVVLFLHAPEPARRPDRLVA